MIRTLVVEDDPMILDVNCGYLQRVAGFVVAGVARNGAEALAAAREKPLELMLLDFGLPDMSGLDVCRALRAAPTPPVDIIALTAARDTATVRAALAYGVVQYLIKPYRFSYFREKLEAYAQYHHGLPSGQTTSQCELDDLVDKLRVDRNAALPKDLSPHTYELIVGVLRRAEQPLPATDIADAAGLARPTARRYLDHLRGQDLVVRTNRYGSTGRPTHLYHWAEPTPPPEHSTDVSW